MFVKKKILLVCKETYSYPLYFLAKKWAKENDVAAFFFNPCETMYNKCYLNDSTYYVYKELDGVKLYTSDAITKEFTKLLNSEIIDYEYLKEIEDKYTHFANLNLQIVSTQFFTRHYHFRNYMHSCTYNQQMNWLILNYQNVIKIFDDFKPDVIIDCDSAELARCVINEVAFARKIPYISPSYSRYDNFLTFSYSLGKEIEPAFIESYNNLLANNGSDLDKEKEYIRQFNEKSNIMPERFKNTVTSQYKPKSLYRAAKNIWGITRYFWNQDITAKNLKLKHSNKVLFNGSLQYVLFYIRYEKNNRRLLRKNSYFETPVEGEPYVYMPLHLIPESTTATLSPMYINELSIIEAVSKSLPAGWWLYVKEHQSMLGERSLEFYKNVKKLPNVRLVQINYYKDPKPWITQSKGVVTISGTTAYEAALLHKPSVVFSNVPFSLINSIQRIDSFEKLPEAIKKFTEPVYNEDSCAAYLAATRKLGYPIKIKYLMDEGERIIRGKSEFTEEYQKELDNLEAMFFKGYEVFTN